MGPSLIMPETLLPEHLDELTGLAGACLLAVDSAKGIAEGLRGTDDDRWWLQERLLNAMTNGVRGRRMLDMGLEREILLTYPSSEAFSGEGVTASNAHRLATDAAIELVRRAWSVVYEAQGLRTISFGRMLEDPRPLVRMQPVDKDDDPLFRVEDVKAVADAILAYPSFDPFEVQAKIDWEYVKVKDRQLHESVPTSTELNPDAQMDASSPQAARTEQGEGSGGKAVALPDATAKHDPQRIVTNPPLSEIVLLEIELDPLKQRIIRHVGGLQTQKTGKEICKDLKMPYSGHIKEKFAELRKMGVFDAGHGYPLSEKGQGIYRALKDRKKSS